MAALRNIWPFALMAMVVVAGLLAMFHLALTYPSAPNYVVRIALPGKDGLALPAIIGQNGDDDRPLVVIDAGHGGFDPGASGPGVIEKDITLALALAVRDELVASGDVRVALTRDEDRFLSLGERSDIARRLEADLFLSLHADSAGDAEEVEGASIYTLSNRSSDRSAAAFAARENAADTVNGTELGGQTDAVRSILIDLSRRRSQEDAANFARIIEREGGDLLNFRVPAQRQAALIVLQSPDVPSVLFEAGYISNASEAASMASPEGRAVFARVLASAVRRYFIEAAAASRAVRAP